MQYFVYAESLEKFGGFTEILVNHFKNSSFCRFRRRFQPSTIIIAHRLKTIEYADTIAVVDGGVIIEQGSHAELMAAHGLHASFPLLHRSFVDPVAGAYYQMVQKSLAELGDETAV